MREWRLIPESFGPHGPSSLDTASGGPAQGVGGHLWPPRSAKHCTLHSRARFGAHRPRPLRLAAGPACLRLLSQSSSPSRLRPPFLSRLSPQPPRSPALVSSNWSLGLPVFYQCSNHRLPPSPHLSAPRTRRDHPRDPEPLPPALPLPLSDWPQVLPVCFMLTNPCRLQR